MLYFFKITGERFMCAEVKEACGVVGVYLPEGLAAREIFFSLFAIQHRGPDGAGITTWSAHGLKTHSGNGLVAQVFTEEALLELAGKVGIGHVLCNTGSENSTILQPITVNGNSGSVAVAHNGHLTNADILRQKLGPEMATPSHAEIIARLIATTPVVSWKNRFQIVMGQLQGSYSLTILAEGIVFGIRDPLGLKPLCVGQVRGAWIIASETCALENLDATNVREIEPGEVVQLDGAGLKSFFPLGNSHQTAHCALEESYLLRPDSRLNDRSAYSIRFELGRRLALEHPVVGADLVIDVPDSATPAAIGFAAASGIDFRTGLVKNRYVGHTLVEPSPRIQDTGIRLKFNALEEILRGQRIVVVDDRIVLGGTTAAVTALLRERGAKEVHLRITTPPITNTCHYGVAISTQGELIGRRDKKEICQLLGANSLEYLSLPSMTAVMGIEGKSCHGCFTGVYPTTTQSNLALTI